MNLSKWSRRLIPSFLKKQKEVKHVPNGLDHLCYEFTIESPQKMDVDAIRKTILVSPWSLIGKPVIDRKGNENQSVWTISFYVLSSEKGKEIEDSLRTFLSNSD